MNQYRTVRLDLFPAAAPKDVASWSVEGKTLLDWQAEFLQRRGVKEVVVTDTPAARALLDRPLPCRVIWTDAGVGAGTTEVGIPEPTGSDEIRVDVNQAFERVSFLQELKKGRTAQPTVLWTVRTQTDLAPACAEWVRNEWLPLGSDYIKLSAHRIAAFCADTPLTPNHLTLGTLLCALGVLALLVFDVPGWSWIAPPLVIFAVILDFADGRLARLKNAGSAFGGFLDSVVGDLTEDLCYLGVILYLSLHTGFGSSNALALGTLYFFGKYQAYLGLQYQARYLHAPARESGMAVPAPLSSRQPLAYAFVVFEFTVVRYHLLALALLLRQPAALLIFYTLHFNARWILRVALVSARHLFAKPGPR